MPISHQFIAGFVISKAGMMTIKQTNKSKYTSETASCHWLYDTAQWKRLRKAQLNANPLCVMCIKQGLTTQACIVDHIKPHKGDKVLFYDADNLQSLCKLHHDSSKQAHERTGIERGADINGYPIDKQHHWNK